MDYDKVMTNQLYKFLPYSIYFFVFGSFSFIYTQLIPFLTYLGFDAFERGIILSSISLLSLLTQVIYGYLSDKHNKIKPFFNFSFLTLGVLSYILYQSSQSDFFLILLLVSFAGALFRTLAGYLETWTLLTDKNAKNRFGGIRAFGSIGWAIMAPLTSIIVENYGYNMLASVILVITLVSLILTMLQEDVSSVQSSSIRLSDIQELIKTPDYLLLLIIFALINMGFNTDNFTVIDKMIFLNATNSQVGLKWSIQAIIELPLLLASGWLLMKFNMIKILRIAIIFFIARIFLNAIAVNPNQILLISILQGITFPLSFLVQKFMIDEITPLKLRSSAQMIGLAFYGAFPAFLTPLLSGLFVNLFGFNFTLCIFGIALFVGYFFTYRLTQFHKTKI